MRIILLRHGQTTSNVAGLLDTAEPGAGLTSLGREQAAAVPGALAGEQVEAIYVSTLRRTQQTAAPLASDRALEVVVREGLREVRAGDLEMRGDEASVRTYLETALGWAHDEHRRMPGGENGVEVLARFDEVLAEVAAAGLRTAVLVSHGAIIRSWTSARARNVTAEFAMRNAVSNTGAVVVEGQPGAWHVATWEGHAVGGPAVDEPRQDGPAGDRASVDAGAEHRAGMGR